MNQVEHYLIYSNVIIEHRHDNDAMSHTRLVGKFVEELAVRRELVGCMCDGQ